MTDVPDNLSRAARLAAGAFVLAVAALVALLFVPVGTPAARIAVLTVSGVVSPLLTVIALLTLMTPALGPARRYRAAVVTAAAVAFSADILFLEALSVSADQSDAGLPRPAFAGLAPEFALVSAMGFATLVALLLFVLLRRDDGLRPALTGVISSVIAVVITPFLLLSLAAPPITAVAALAVAVVALIRRSTAGSRPPLQLRPAPSGSSARLLVTQVRVLSAGSLVYTAVVWAGGVGGSIATTGTEAASSSLGAASGAAQLAALPLLLAGALVARTRATIAYPLWAGTAVATALIATVSAGMVVGYTPDGDAFVRDLALLALAVGAWCASIVGALTVRLPTAARVGVCGLALLGGTVLYLGGGALVAAIPLAITSAFLAFGGASRMLRERPATTPVRPRASA